MSLDDERRRYYRLTPLGRRVAAAEIARLESIVEMARAKKLVPPAEVEREPTADGRSPARRSTVPRAAPGVPVRLPTDHGREMEQTFHAQRREAHQEGSMTALARLWLETFRDVFTTAPREHLAILRQDVGYALRALRRAPVFAARPS